MFKFVFLLLISFVVAQTNLLYINYNTDYSEYDVYDNMMNGAQVPLTITEIDALANPNFMLSAISLDFDMVALSAQNQLFSESYTASELIIIQSNIESYTNSGGVFLLFGYDVIASPDDQFWIDILGGTGSYDCSGAGYYDFNAFPVSSVCDPLLTGFENIQGDSLITEVEEFGDLDCLYYSGGSAVPCLTSTEYTGAIWSIRPMANTGIIIFMATSSAPYGQYAFDSDSDFEIAFNNLLVYAVSGGAGGDPHVIDFFGNHFDIPGTIGEPILYRLYKDESRSVNINIEESFIHDIAIQIHEFEEEYNFLATICDNYEACFYLNDVKLEIPGSYMNGMIVLSYDVEPVLDRETFKETSKHISTLVSIENFALITGGNYLPMANVGFFNIDIRHHSVDIIKRDAPNPTILQTPRKLSRSDDRFEEMMVSSLWE